MRTAPRGRAARLHDDRASGGDHRDAGARRGGHPDGEVRRQAAEGARAAPGAAHHAHGDRPVQEVLRHRRDRQGGGRFGMLSPRPRDAGEGGREQQGAGGEDQVHAPRPPRPDDHLVRLGPALVPGRPGLLFVGARERLRRLHDLGRQGPRRHQVQGLVMRHERGFTLIEMLIVVTLIGIIAGIAAVQLRQTPLKAKEAVLKEDLYILRDVIDQYFADKGKYPESLQTLVENGYIRKLPVDPFTHEASTWATVQADTNEDDPQAAGGIVDVHSGSDGTAIDGSRYSDW